MNKTFISLLGALLCATTLYAATIHVSPGSGTIKTAVGNASAGDILLLSDGEYSESSVKPAVGIAIQAAEGANPVVILTSRFEVSADFSIQGVNIQSSGEAVRMMPGSSPYNVIVRDCELSGCPSYFIRAYNTEQECPYINQLTVDNCLFRMGGGEANSARGIAATKIPFQINSLSIRNSTFDGGPNGTGRIIYLHAGDENNVIPLQGSLEIDHCTFYNSTDTRGVYLANIQGSHVTNCIFMNTEERSGAVSFALYGGDSRIENCLSCNAPLKLSTGAKSVACINRNPYFVDANAGNFQLYKNSPAVAAGTDESTLGDPRWGVSTENYDNSNDPYIPYKQPYSMAPTTSSVKILWQMSEEVEPTEALVYYGTDSAHLDRQIATNDGWMVADEGYVHVVTLTGLQPNTRYYFTVGKNANRRYPKISWTKTAPEQGTAFRIFSISDIHGNARNNWSNMQDFICSLNCDIALMNGDFVSSKGDDRNWNNYYFTPGAQFLGKVPVMSSVGNHETGDPFTFRWSSYYDYFHQFAHEGASEGDTIDPRGEAYFHFVYGNADVIMLNLNGDPSSPHFLPGSRQYAWADSILGTCTRPWIIICHHVGVHTTGYHGQWADEPRQMGTLFEKYAKQGKRIISLSGDDHSFEHLYKDGVHYVRPGCGRDANYPQQKQLKDFRYSMFYKQVSCFSTFDMAADASHIYLTAYDSVGNPFYNYDFLLNGEVITPSVNFTVPAQEISVEDSVMLRWFTFDPVGDATVSFYYSQTENASGVEGMTPIVTGLDNKVEKYMWHTRNITPKGKYYIYAVVTSGGKSYMGNRPAVINLLKDTTPPPAPASLTGTVNSGQYRLYWLNPTHLIHLDNLLTDFSNGMEQIEKVGEDGATMAVSLNEGALQCDYSITTAWATAAADYVFDEATDMSQTPFLTFRLKGNGTNTALRIVCKNMSAGHEDWWYTEKITLSNNTWQDIALDLRTLQSFDWYGNTDEKNHLEGIVRISFSVSTGSAVNGTFYLDDLHLSGDISPAPDYAQTVIVRKENAFPASPADGIEIYRGTEETCADASAVVGQVYYYGAFAADNLDNWSAPEAGAQWISENVIDNTGLGNIKGTSESQKFLQDGHLFVRRNSHIYTTIGQIVK
ncbi:MAG: metallophosphoesterase [Paludibacteraceae bacterium]|nr:metallophosphoesterase [Paludibacteraceae bacterium]